MDLQMNNTRKLTKALIISLVSFSFGVQASEQILSRPGIGPRSEYNTRSNIHQQNRSTYIRGCEKLAQIFNGTEDQNWNAILKLGSKNYLSAANITVLKLDQDNEAKERIKVEACSGDATGEDALKESIADFAASVAFCEAYRVSTLQESYTNEHSDKFQDRDSEEDSSAAGNMLACMNQPDQAAQQQCMAQAATGPKMTCKHKGAETHDYLKCKKIMNYVTGFALGKQAMQIQQGFRQSSHDMDNQEDFMQKQRNGEVNLITDSMGLQRDSLEKQGNLAYEMAAFDAAKAATLIAMIKSFPRSEKMETRCKEGLGGVEGGPNLEATITEAVKIGALACAGETELDQKLIVDRTKELIGGGERLIDELCSSAVNDNNHFFLNHEAIDALNQQAMQAGLEAMANAAKGALAHKQAGYIDDAIKDVEEYEPPEFPIAEVPESTVSECLVDPEAEGCVAPPTPGSEGFRGQDFSATFGGSANLGDLAAGRSNADEDDGTGASSTTDRNLIPETFGGIESTAATDNSFADGAARAGSIKTGQAAGGGGGGGGGGAASLGGGGGGPRGPASKKPGSGSKAIKVKTRGSGLGGFGGGRGAIARRKKKSANPFSKLLGKKGKSGNKTLNFRGPAQIGNKKGSLFQMISNRYSDVQEKKRLLKYEKTN